MRWSLTQSDNATSGRSLSGPQFLDSPVLRMTLLAVGVLYLGYWLGDKTTTGIFWERPLVSIASIMGMLFILYYVRRPTYETFFHLTIFTLPLLLGFVVDVGGNLRVPWVFSILALLLGLYQQKLRKLPPELTNQFLFLFLFYSLASTMFTLEADFSLPMEEAGIRLTAFRSFVQAGQLLLMVVAYYLTINYVTSVERLQKVCRLIFWSTVLVVVYGLYDFAAAMFDLPFVALHTKTDYYVGGAADTPFVNIGGVSLPRPRSTLPEPIDLSIFLLFAIPISLQAVSSERIHNLGHWLKVGYLVLAFLLFFSANARAGLVALAVVGVLYWWLADSFAVRRRLVLIIIGVYLTVALVLLPLAGGEASLIGPFTFYQERVASLQALAASMTGQEHEAAYVGRNYSVPITVFEEHPVFGVGLGNYPFYYSRESGEIVVATTFSLYLRLLTELGVVGTTLFLLFVGRIVWLLLGVVRRSPPPQLRPFALASLLSIVGVMVARTALDGLYTDNYMWVMLGLGVAIARLAQESGSPRPADNAGTAGVVPNVRA